MGTIKYDDGKDYSHLKQNEPHNEDYPECLMCGSENVTTTEYADICYECGFVYT